MALSIGGRSTSKVGIVGSGQIGPDIALHFAKVLVPAGGTVVVVDISAEALQRGQAKLEKKIARGEKTGAFKPEFAAAMRGAITFSEDYATLEGADLVVEAASEDIDLKARIFADLEGRLSADAVLLSNSSHLEPERIFAGLTNKGRAAVAHYFFPAERNPVVEIVPGADTDPAVTEWLLAFYEAIGKIPLQVGSRYGYAVDPIFEGIFQAACQIVESGLGTVKEVDYVARAALGMTVGPFTAMNLTGGSPITAHGLTEMHERIGPWCQAPRILKELLENSGSSGMWEVCGRGETAAVAGERGEAIVDSLRGAFLGICFEIVDAGLLSLDDFELAIEVALDQTPPCRMANKLGVGKALELVEAWATAHPDFPVPGTLQAQAALGRPFDVSNLVEQDLEIGHDKAVRLIRIRRPKVLNALDGTTYRQLRRAFADVARDPGVVGAVLTGYGPKAFVSGADIQALAGLRSPEEGIAIARQAHELATQIEGLGKPVVAALNGLAFGGGLELALACTVRIGLDGQKVIAGLPEVNLGIIPAGGGTQRLPRLIGVARAATLLRTGAPVGSKDALALGLVTYLAPADRLIAVAVSVVAHLSAGKMRVPAPSTEPMADAPAELDALDIGHRSQAVDALLCESILFGLGHSLAEGLEHELEVFGRICALEDMRVGIDNFVQNGPRNPATFVHR